MRALVTGGAGFIGHHLVRALLAGGDEVNVIDDFSTGDRARLDAGPGPHPARRGQHPRPGGARRGGRGCEVIFHEAAIPSVARSLVDPGRTNQVNAAGTIEVMLAAARHGVRRVVYAGSSSVYGVPESLPCRESFRPAPESPYGVSKLAAEHYVHTLGKLHGVETVRPALLQRVRAGPGPGVGVCGGRAPLRDRGPRGSRGRRSTVPARSRATSPTSTTWSRPTCWRPAPASPSGTHLQHRLRRAPHPPRAPGGHLRGGRPRRADPIFGPPRPGDIVHSLADISRPGASSATSRRRAVP